jgi:two-component system KDP operon response regulator KdpE
MVGVGRPCHKTDIRPVRRISLKVKEHGDYVRWVGMKGRGHGSVLVVEDQHPTRELLAILLRRAGYEVVCAPDGQAALDLCEQWAPELVLLDLELPGVTGWDVLTQLRRRSGVAICVVTGLMDEAAKVRALNAGADDYIVKSTSTSELVARVGALLRRARLPAAERPLLDDGIVRVDFTRCVAEVDGEELKLTPLEFRLLAAFVRRSGEVLSRDDLLREVWNDDSGGPSDHVKTYVGYLRRKLPEIVQIETVRGFGYRYPGAELLAPTA